MSRPGRRTDEVARARALELVAAGASRKQAARAVGVVTSTVTRWALGPPRPRDQPREGRHCPTCYGLPHRRPEHGLCACGEAYAPDVVAYPVPSLRSSLAAVVAEGENDDGSD